MDRLIVSPEIEWTKEAVSFISEENSISIYPIHYENQLFLEFDVLDTSDAGKYTCEATVIISDISLIVANSSVEVLKLQSEYIKLIVNSIQFDKCHKKEQGLHTTHNYEEQTPPLSTRF